MSRGRFADRPVIKQSGPSGLGVEEARDKLVGCRADVAGLAAWDVSGGKKGTTYAATLH